MVCTAGALVLGATACVGHLSAQRPRFDVVISNGRIVDGTGAPWFKGDIGIAGDRITGFDVATITHDDHAGDRAFGGIVFVTPLRDHDVVDFVGEETRGTGEEERRLK